MKWKIFEIELLFIITLPNWLKKIQGTGIVIQVHASN